MTIGKNYTLSALRDGPVRKTLVASAAEREKIAERFGFLEVPEFSAEIELSARSQGALLKAHIRGGIVQQCGITLEDVSEAIDEAVSIQFIPATGYSDEDHVADTETEIEVFEGDSLNVGEALIQVFALAANPYPRRADANLSKVELPKGAKIGDESQDSDDKARKSPFAVLAGLVEKT